jgi:hypothetical protein
MKRSGFRGVALCDSTNPMAFTANAVRLMWGLNNAFFPLFKFLTFNNKQVRIDFFTRCRDKLILFGDGEVIVCTSHMSLCDEHDGDQFITRTGAAVAIAEQHSLGGDYQRAAIHIQQIVALGEATVHSYLLADPNFPASVP